ncbi:hypothetical protein SAMN05428949_5997 [Chitinophaga sp. YR627]|nr:hypothetical protein SAMN05428949_5997 [Chitinophaga sp. YR627]
MIISFDLDDTLIPGRIQFPLERQFPWHKLISRERLRKGSILLIRQLKQEGCKVYVYTTSLRSPMYIRCLFLSYGIWLDKVINKTVHDRVLGKQGQEVSKLPGAFNIDLHVDDSSGVEMEGVKYNFATVIIGEEEDWMEKVREKLRIKN